MKCPEGKYFCNDRQKCMPIPKGTRVRKDGQLVKEASVSKKQQRFFGMVRAAQKGEMKNPSPEVAKVAGDISKKDAKKFAKTKHKGLPEKKKINETDYGKLKGWEKSILQGGLKVRSGVSYDKEMARLVKMYPGFKAEETNPRIPRKKGQPANSKKHSDLYTDENPKGTIHNLGFKNVAKAKASVTKIRNSSRSHAHKIQAAVAMEQRAREMGKTAEAAVYRKYINSMKKKTKSMNEGIARFDKLMKAIKGSDVKKDKEVKLMKVAGKVRGIPEEVSRRRKPSAIKKRKKLDSVMNKYDDLKKKIGSKEKHMEPALKEMTYQEAIDAGWEMTGEGIWWPPQQETVTEKITFPKFRKKVEERKPKKAMDAGAKARRKLKRKEHAKYVSGSEDNVPDDIRDHKEYTE